MIISPMVIGHSRSSLPEEYINNTSNITYYTPIIASCTTKKTYIQYITLYTITTIHYVVDKKWLYNLLENAAGDNRELSNIKSSLRKHKSKIADVMADRY